MSWIDRMMWRRPEPWIALTILVLSYFAETPIEFFLARRIVHALHLHHAGKNILSPPSFAVLLSLRLAWQAGLFALVCAVLRRSATGFPIRDRAAGTRLLGGLIIGVAVMAAAILGIYAVGAGSIASSSQPAGSAVAYGTSWLVVDGLGAAGEELFGRASILLVAERLLGWRLAMLVSGLMFSVGHLDNPGADPVWLLRLFLQGVLLAYAVYRTRSLWWSIGYHTGWNWASAPLFGAAGSGYLDEGHLFDFQPTGTPWITGGAVGPEGSLFAFIAVLAAFGLLIATQRGSWKPEMRSGPGAALPADG